MKKNTDMNNKWSICFFFVCFFVGGGAGCTKKVTLEVFTFMWRFKDLFVKVCGQSCQVSVKFPPQLHWNKKWSMKVRCQHTCGHIMCLLYVDIIYAYKPVHRTKEKKTKFINIKLLGVLAWSKHCFTELQNKNIFLPYLCSHCSI